MAFIQLKLTKSLNQSRDIFDKYIYQPGNADSIATILGSGYFDDSRYLDDPDWIGSIIEISATNGYAIARIAVGGLVVLYDSTGGGSVNVEWGSITGDITSQADLAEVAKTNDYDDLNSKPVLPENRIIVTQASDLSGMLDSTKQYFIDGVIDMGSQSIEVPQGGLTLSGYSFDLSKLTSSEAAYTMFTSPVGGSGNLLGMDYAIEATGVGSQVYDLVSDTGFNAFEFTRINYNNCSSLGSIDNYRQGLEIGTGRFGGKPELTLVGTWVGGYFIDTSIIRGLDDGAYSLFKAGAGFSMSSRFRSNMNIDLPASASFFDFAPGNFVNASTLQIDGAIVTRNGVFDATDSNITPNITEADLASNWKGNNGMPNTFEGGSIGVTTELATANSGVGTGVFLDLAATLWTTSDLQHFNNPVDGQLKHLGNTPREFKVVADLVLESSTNNVVTLRVVKWDDSASSFVTVLDQTRQVNALVGGRDVAFFSVNINTTLDKDDYIKLQVANVSATNDITAETDSYYIIEER